MPRAQLAEARRHLDDAERLVLEFRALLRAERVHAPRHDGAAPAHRGTAEPPAATPHGEHAAGNAPPTEHRATAPAIPHGLMLALSVLDDAALRCEFDAFVDPASVTDKGGRLSKEGLAALMRTKGLAHGDAQVGRVLARVDTNKDGKIDFGEFRALARANSDLEQVLLSKHFECVVAAFFPSGTTFEDLGKMSRAQFSAVVDQSRDAQIEFLAGLGAQVAAVGSAQQAVEGGKFASELKGGTLEDFYQGVTGICGEPDADLEAGMRREHTQCADADVAFSTPNYGITTTPRTEFELVVSGGSGCEAAPGSEEGVVVKGTRGCFKASGLKWCKACLCSDPTSPHFTRGMLWEDVGAAKPTEGRRLAIAKLQDALQKLEGDVMQFAQEDVDAFGFTDLRSTDFIEAGGRYFQPAASRAQILENAGLAEALMCQTEFTQPEWDAFGISDLRVSHLVKAGDSYCRPAETEEQKDVRVVRPFAYYGDFGQNGRLKWGVGDVVVVGEAFTVCVMEPKWQGDLNPTKVKKEIPKGTEGTVLELNDEGAAKIVFRAPVSEGHRVHKDQFYCLYPLPNEKDMPIQRRVKLARLRRCDVIALVLYTGACFRAVRELVLSNKRMHPLKPCASPGLQLIVILARKFTCPPNYAHPSAEQAQCSYSTTRCSEVSAFAAR